MRAFRTLASATVLAAGLAAFPAPALAATTYTFGVTGVEVSATATTGVFTGAAASDAAIGTWSASVNHTPLGTSADITGGWFRMYLVPAAPAYTVTGEFSGGTIDQSNPPSKCGTQVFDVVGKLKNVTGNRTGAFDVDLTHYRVSFLGRCRTIAATVVGKVTLS